MKQKTRINLLLLSALSLGAPALTCIHAADTTRETPGQYIDDATVTAKVKAELIRDDQVRGRDVKVTTEHGTVQLSGFVDTDAQRARAAEIAATIEGVKSVQNLITVK
jgi:hyperosmotically inducible protein